MQFSCNFRGTVSDKHNDDSNQGCSQYWLQCQKQAKFEEINKEKDKDKEKVNANAKTTDCSILFEATKLEALNKFSDSPDKCSTQHRTFVGQRNAQAYVALCLRQASSTQMFNDCGFALTQAYYGNASECRNNRTKLKIVRHKLVAPKLAIAAIFIFASLFCCIDFSIALEIPKQIANHYIKSNLTTNKWHNISSNASNKSGTHVVSIGEYIDSEKNNRTLETNSLRQGEKPDDPHADVLTIEPANALQKQQSKNHDDLLNSESRTRNMWQSIDKSNDNSGDTSDASQSENDLHEDVDRPDSYDQAQDSITSERKAVKELSRLISKGLTGVSDALVADKSDSLRKRQKERKEKRSEQVKLYTELLTDALNNHVERGDSKKKTKKKFKSNNQNPKHRNHPNAHKSYTDAFGNEETLREELGVDSEYLFNKLQSLTSLADATSNSADSGEETDPHVSNQDSADDDQSPQTKEDGGESSSSDEVYDDNSTKNNAEQGSSTQDDSSVKKSQGKIVKHLKKIKKQFLQRRKQLDQIKNIFNVELSLNNKDGTLVGKTTNNNEKKGKKDKVNYPNSEQDSDYTVLDDYVQTGNKRHRSGNSQSSSKPNSVSKAIKSKSMRDLIGYLKENPEILSSIMSELYAESENMAPSRKATFSVVDQPSSSRQLNVIDLLDNNDRSTSRSKPMKRSHANMYHYSLEPSFQTDILTRRKSVTEYVFPQTKSQGLNKVELLKALKERQLINLGKLEMAIASKQVESTKFDQTTGDLLDSRYRLGLDREASSVAESNVNSSLPVELSSTSQFEHKKIVQPSANVFYHDTNLSGLSKTSTPIHKSIKLVDEPDHRHAHINNLTLSNDESSRKTNRDSQQKLVFDDNSSKRVMKTLNYSRPEHSGYDQYQGSLNRFKDWKDVGKNVENPQSRYQRQDTIDSYPDQMTNNFGSRSIEQSNNLNNRIAGIDFLYEESNKNDLSDGRGTANIGLDPSNAGAPHLSYIQNPTNDNYQSKHHTFEGRNLENKNIDEDEVAESQEDNEVSASSDEDSIDHDTSKKKISDYFRSYKNYSRPQTVSP